MELLTPTFTLGLIDGVGFDPFFRGLLSVLAGVVVLIGSVYLIVATNTGSRQGGMVALAGLTGWMFLMGIIWTIYGIGWKGDAPTWQLVEIDVDDADDNDDGLLYSEVGPAVALTASASGSGIPDGGLGAATFDRGELLDRFPDEETRAQAEDLLGDATMVGEISDVDLAQEAALVASRERDIGDWRYLITADPTRGEAQASVDEFLVEEGVFEAGDYLARQFGAFIIDGKPTLDEDANIFDRVVHTVDETVVHPAFAQELIVVQVQGIVEEPTLPGQAPPVFAVDDSEPLVSVIMQRDRGGPVPALFSGLRFTPAMFTLFNGVVFAVIAWNLHVRDRRVAEIRGAAA
jgi:hypothetical protein